MDITRTRVPIMLEFGPCSIQTLPHLMEESRKLDLLCGEVLDLRLGNASLQHRHPREKCLKLRR
jgi:hypothetical protein